MATMVEAPQRRAWERELLIRYFAKLQAAGGPRVAVEDAWQHYRTQLPAALLMWTPTLCHPPTIPDMQPEAASLEWAQAAGGAVHNGGRTTFSGRFSCASLLPTPPTTYSN